MANKQQRLILAIVQELVFLLGRQRRLRHMCGQGIGLKYDIAVGLRRLGPELGAKMRPGITIIPGQGQAIGQTHIGAAEQPTTGTRGKTARLGGGLNKGLIDAALRVTLA